MALPGGTVTFLLTDVEDSARAWQERPEQTSGAIATLEATITEVVAGEGGHVLKSRGEGDSSFCVFASASGAVAAAVALQLTLRGGPLKVRIALHTGDAEMRAGDYYGVTPSKCARLRGVAAGGQILCSAATAAVATGLPPGVTLRDIGSVRLRSFLEPERVSQVCHPDLASEFPRIDGHETLPAALTSFVGRDKECKAVQEALHGSRLVTLTGAGGCGKSRLAVEVARDLDALGGVWFVDLSPVADPGEIRREIGVALGLGPLSSSEAAIHERLDAGAPVVVLDNCEHLIEAVSQECERLLQRCRQLTIITTSREPLGIAGECILRVPSLPTEESVRLFLDRAHGSLGSARSESVMRQISDICDRLDGIPLAVELAAARTGSLSLPDIAAGLEDRFALLTSGGRTALSRQRTLEASVDWSYELLTGDEQALLRRLAVFVGTFSLDAATAVAPAPGGAIDTLSSLVTKSLVTPVDVGRLPRYRLLDTIRYYAQRKLTEAGEHDDAVHSHFAYYLDLARELADASWSDRQAWAMATMYAEAANMGAATDHAVGAGDHDAGLEICGAMWLSALDPQREQSGWLHRVLDATEGASPDRRLWVYLYLGSIYWNLADMRSFIRCARAALELRPRLTDRRARGGSLLIEALLASLTSMTEARAVLAEADALAAGGGELAGARYTAGLLEAVWGDVESALDVLDRTAGASEAGGFGLMQLLALDVGARAALNCGRLTDAEVFVDRGREAGGWIPTAYTGVSIVQLFLPLLRGDADAARVVDRELSRPDRPEAIRLRPKVLVAAMRRALIEGDAVSARMHVEAASRTPLRFVAELPFTLVDHVETCILAGDPGLADETVAAVEPIFTPSGEIETGLPMYAGVRLARARVALHLGRTEEAIAAARDTLSAIEACRAHLGTPDALRILGVALYESGDIERGVRLGAASEALAASMGIVLPPTRPSLDALRSHPDEWASGLAMTRDEAIAYARRGQGPRGRPSSGWDSLTPTERQVVGLVVEGLPNKDIAARLFMSVPTVKSHLTHTYAKLGLASRAELIAAASRLRSRG